MNFEPTDDDTTTRSALALIGAFLVVRLVVAWVFPATIDEAYAIAVSRDWSLSYFDHPPVGFTLAHIMAWATGTETIFIVRLPFILAGAVSAWLVFDITRLAYGYRAALWAVGWFSVAPFFFISAGHFVVPDGPLNLFLLITLRLVLPDLLDTAKPPRSSRWLLAGMALALALASKYQAVLFGVSALAFLLASAPHRRLFGLPALWGAFAIAALGLLPALIWNAGHDWISFGFQAGRAASAGDTSLHPGNLAVTLVGQMAYLLPGTWIVIMFTAASGVFRTGSPADRLFGWLTILPAVLFLAIAVVSRNSLPHWAMSGFLFGFPLAGKWCAGMFERYRGVMLLAWRASWIGIPLLALCVGLQANYALFSRPFFAEAPKQDVDWQLQDWWALREVWPELGNPGMVVVQSWLAGAKAGHALGPDVEVLPITDPRHFQYLEPAETGAAIAVQPAKPGEVEANLAAFARNLEAAGFRIIGEPRTIPQKNGDFLRFNIIAIPVTRDH
jgi:4-amino-4-deoxy-L-arabinose transferase-like glycosyltransferase